VTLRSLLAVVAAAVFVAAPTQAATKSARHRSRRPVAAPQLVWYVESVDGQVLDARREDLPINPASVVKIATSW
jgi:D-alanyl-D-alanine carboxypeptidase